MRLWEPNTGKELVVLTGHTKQVDSIMFSADGKYLASADLSRVIRLWDAHSFKELAVLKGDNMSFSPDGQYLATMNASDKTVRIWDVLKSKENKIFQDHTSGRGIRRVMFNPNGKYVASVGHDNTILRDLETDQYIISFQGAATTFSPDGKHLATFTNRNIVQLWDAQSGRKISATQDELGAFISVALSPDGKYLAGGTSGGNVWLWKGLTTKVVAFSAKEAGEVTEVKFSPDATRLLTWHSDLTTRIWDVHTSAELAVLPGRVVEFSPNSKYLILASAKRNGSTWEARR